MENQGLTNNHSTPKLCVSLQTLDLPTPVLVTSIFGDIVKDTIVASSPTVRLMASGALHRHHSLHATP